ncbi:MAG: hypothetical protein SOW18_05855 [Peptoniphilus sp.]|nr:hypothetical protein [Peptoniphilus sp.]MDY3119042.1 hypothetical protein [Peptoniphilus sp.]
MKIFRRIGIVILLVGLPYVMQGIQPDWEQMAWESFSAAVANSWLFKLAVLFFAGILSYRMIYDMTHREKIFWGVGLLVVVACCYLLARVGNKYAFRYIGNSPDTTTTISFLSALLLADGFRNRHREEEK